ncbi:uncharacterized protein LOC128550481 [Mercenaria mercenaria]|uniref:uncharacterized protein LOC128550481 n=1 Tax=Mercenaria mercenaria TaxID=6596 RepID=UPI00234E4207|nr:uncharacterized protein LOC128550481 [Mercenaria mercenaria]
MGIADVDAGSFFLTACYNSTPGFMSVTVIRFRKGSIIVDYDVRIRNPQSVEAAVNHINQNISAIIKQADEEIKEFEINRDQTNNLMTANISMIGETGEQAICQSFSDVCRFGYNCTFNTVGDRVEASCQSKCSQQSSFCGIHGQCYIDHRSEALKCRCDEEENYVYIGERCGNRMELVKLKKKYIILIASGSGGLFIIALIVVIICLLKRRKSHDQERKQKEDETLTIHRDVEEYPQLDRYNESHSSREFSDQRGTKWTENQYQRSLLDTRYFDGREHKVLRNDSGKESHPNPGYSLPPSNKSVYDYIDTSSRFEIKRPNVHIGRKF